MGTEDPQLVSPKMRYLAGLEGSLVVEGHDKLGLDCDSEDKKQNMKNM